MHTNIYDAVRIFLYIQTIAATATATIVTTVVVVVGGVTIIIQQTASTNDWLRSTWKWQGSRELLYICIAMITGHVMYEFEAIAIVF